MKKETTPPSTQTSDGAPTEADQTMYQRNLFLVLLLNMTWQLAIVVLVPFVGGFELDKHLHTTPLWTIVGGVIAVLGFIAVVMRILAVAKGRSGYGSVTPHGDKK